MLQQIPISLKCCVMTLGIHEIKSDRQGIFRGGVIHNGFNMLEIIL